MRDAILSELLHLSDRQLDPAAKKRIRDLIGLSDRDVREPLHNLRDLCVRYSWCSSFELSVLTVLIHPLGITEQEVLLFRQALEGL